MTDSQEFSSPNPAGFTEPLGDYVKAKIDASENLRGIFYFVTGPIPRHLNTDMSDANTIDVEAQTVLPALPEPTPDTQTEGQL